MEMIVKKWGNSLATRIPKAIADTIGLKLNQKINIETENGRIIISPAPDKQEYTVEELLSKSSKDAFELDDENRSWLNEEPVGKEW